MSRTDRLLARVRARLVLVGAATDLQLGLVAAAAVVLLAVLGRAFAVVVLDWSVIAAIAVIALVMLPLIGLIRRRRSPAALAAHADRGLALSERVSTALWAERNADVAGPLASEVRRDADETAAEIDGAHIRRAFQPRLERRPLLAAAMLVAVTGALLFVGPGEASVIESGEDRAARLADEERIADVARRMAQAAKRVEDLAGERKQDDLAKLAAEIAKQTQRMSAAPPQRPKALQKLNELADQARATARKRSGMKTPTTEAEAREGNKQLADLLRKMSASGLENLQKDLKQLTDRLDAGEKGDSQVSADDMRAMANRLDALARAMKNADALGMKDLREQLQSIGNEDLLRKIAERMREIASKMEAGEDYQNLESPDANDLDMSQMTREELEELLKQLDELANMEDLAEMLRQGSREMSGGRRMRIPQPGGT